MTENLARFDETFYTFHSVDSIWFLNFLQFSDSIVGNVQRDQMVELFVQYLPKSVE